MNYEDDYKLPKFDDYDLDVKNHIVRPDRFIHRWRLCSEHIN